jgi:hypothetical protein
MATARRLDKHPRIARKKKPVAVLNDDQARLMFAGEKTYRERLFRDFVKFARDCNAWVVSPPFERRCRVLVPDGSTLLQRLAELPRFPVVKLPNVSHRLTHSRFVPVREIEVTLWQ